jgi:hypothetical protein
MGGPPNDPSPTLPASGGEGAARRTAAFFRIRTFTKPSVRLGRRRRRGGGLGDGLRLAADDDGEQALAP